MSTQERYLNPFTDFGFKKLFGTEVNKDLLISFLNAILPKEATISDLTYLKSEHLGHSAMDRKVIYDLYCENSKGEKFIVELQKARQKYFKERTIFYSTFPIQEQSKKGDWDFHLNAVYSVSILNFLIDDNSHAIKSQKREEQAPVKTTAKLMDIATKELFYDKLTYVQVHIPLFDKKEAELETLEDKWLFVIQNLQSFQDRPSHLQERIFDKVFQTAELAQFNRKERMAYEDSLKYYRDIRNVENTAREKGLQEGLEEGIKQGREEGLEEGVKKGLEEGVKKGLEKGKKEQILEMIRNGLARGYSYDILSDITGLEISEVKKIAESIK